MLTGLPLDILEIIFRYANLGKLPEKIRFFSKSLLEIETLLQMKLLCQHLNRALSGPKLSHLYHGKYMTWWWKH